MMKCVLTIVGMLFCLETKQYKKNNRFIDALKVFTDHQWCNPVSGQYGITKTMANGVWYAWGLTDINQWSLCLRIDANVLASAKTHLLLCYVRLSIAV